MLVMWMRLVTMVIVLILTTRSIVCGQDDIGYDLLFTSNKQSAKNVAIKFDPQLPSWIKGTLVRNGPAVFEEGSMAFMHALDGYAKLLKIDFMANRSAYFSTNVLYTNSFKQAEQRNAIAPYLLVGDTKPSFSHIEKIYAMLNEADNTNINVFRFPARSRHKQWEFVALSDYWHVYTFDIENLGPAYKIKPNIPITSQYLYNYFPMVSSAHPLQEYGKDTYINLLSVLNPLPSEKNIINVVRIHNSGDRENIVTIKCDQISYMHSFGLTKNYAIFFADPIYISFTKALETAEMLRSLEWKPESGTTIHIVNLATKQVFNLQTVSGFHLHNINSYEFNGKIITDFVVYPDIKYFSSLDLTVMRNSTKRNSMNPNGQLVRYEINIAKKIVTRKVIKSSAVKFINSLDLPVINDNYRFSPYCYIYGIVTKAAGHNLSDMAIVKKDLCMNRDAFWQETNHYPTEPTFVATPNPLNEDDGILFSIVLDGHNKTSYVLVLNATTLTTISKSYLPMAVPFLIHGRFFEGG